MSENDKVHERQSEDMAEALGVLKQGWPWLNWTRELNTLTGSDPKMSVEVTLGASGWTAKATLLSQLWRMEGVEHPTAAAALADLSLYGLRTALKSGAGQLRDKCDKLLSENRELQRALGQTPVAGSRPQGGLFTEQERTSAEGFLREVWEEAERQRGKWGADSDLRYEAGDWVALIARQAVRLWEGGSSRTPRQVFVEVAAVALSGALAHQKRVS
jgi:hypothetical protein